MKRNCGSAAIAVLVVGVLACSEDKSSERAGPMVDASPSAATTGDAGASPGTTSGNPTAGGGTGAGGATGMGTTAGGMTRDAGSAPVTDSGSAVDSGVGNGDASPAGDGGTTDGGATGGAFAACVAGLKVCKYDEKETACSSVSTPVIPLSDGTTYGNNVLMQGPYGSYVEWNEGMAFANPENILEGTCDLVAGPAFMEPQSVTDDVLDLRGQKLSLYTVFRPACMKDGEKYPVITWGNGTCGQAGGYAGLLATLASHGFVVVAANSRWTDAGNNEMLKALDLAKAMNEDATNPLFGHLDLTKVGAMGHSQGAAATAHAATDPRIKAVILWNGADDIPVEKPFLTVAGDRDTSNRSVAMVSGKVNASTQPAAWLYYHKVLVTGGSTTGHLTLMMQPERVTEPTIAWWKYILLGDQEAKKMFAGPDCGLCNKKDDFEFGQKNIQ